MKKLLRWISALLLIRKFYLHAKIPVRLYWSQILEKKKILHFLQHPSTAFKNGIFFYTVAKNLFSLFLAPCLKNVIYVNLKKKNRHYRVVGCKPIYNFRNFDHLNKLKEKNYRIWVKWGHCTENLYKYIFIYNGGLRPCTLRALPLINLGF